MARLEPGSVFAGHRIEGVAGRGGMGIVYRATDLELQREVALKVISEELAQDPDFRARFRRESRLAARIRHPHALAVHRSGEEDGLLYITMDYVVGEDLGTLIDRGGPLTPERATGIIAQVAEALDAAHAQGIIHRDVKPTNILLAADGGVYLADFGLSRSMNQASTRLTRTGTFLGTFAYAAPEQFGAGPVDGRCDVYSLGCVLFNALTAHAPYERETPGALVLAHMVEAPPSPHAIVGAVSPALDAVVRRAMAKAPDDRFASAGELGRLAVAAAHGADAESLGLPPPANETQVPGMASAAGTGASAPTQLAPRARPVARRRRALMMAGAGVLAAGLVAGIVAIAAGGGSGRGPAGRTGGSGAAGKAPGAGSATKLFSSSRVPFTFTYPATITSKPEAHLTAFMLSGSPTGYVALGPGDFVAVGGPTPGSAAEQQARYRRTGLPFMVRHETHSGLSMTVIDQVGATVADYFFNFGGGNWQIECSAFTQRVLIAQACSQAINSIH